MTESFRIEKDSLGEMQVPANALYGAQTQRAVLNFPVSGMKPYPAFVWAQAMVKRAAAEVNRDLGLLEARLADAIIQLPMRCSRVSTPISLWSIPSRPARAPRTI